MNSQASTEYSITSIYNDGTHLAGSGYRTEPEVLRHLRDRVSYNNNYTAFIIIKTTTVGRAQPTIEIEQLTRAQVEARVIAAAA